MRIGPVAIAGIIQLALLPIQATKVSALCNYYNEPSRQQTCESDERIRRDSERRWAETQQQMRQQDSRPTQCRPKEGCQLTTTAGDIVFFTQLDSSGRYRRLYMGGINHNGFRQPQTLTTIDCVWRRSATPGDARRVWTFSASESGTTHRWDIHEGTAVDLIISTVCR